MIDAHIHIEFGEYTLEYFEKMVASAIKNGVTEIRVLDHTHKFLEFKPLYEGIRINEFNKNWYDKKKLIPISDYLDFIKLVKTKEYPIKVLFGLEVCYFEDKEEVLKEILSRYKFDFLIGSVHFIDNFGFDLSKKIWESQDVDHLYKRYYQIMQSLIKSKIFTSLGHPDSIKVYGFYPNYDLSEDYKKIAKLLVEYNLETENNSGLVRYGFSYPGLNPELLKILKAENVKINRSSDAHKIEDIGRCFDQLEV